MDEMERLKKMKELGDENKRLKSICFLLIRKLRIWDFKDRILRIRHLKTEEMVRWKLITEKKEETGTRTIWAWALKN